MCSLTEDKTEDSIQQYEYTTPQSVSRIGGFTLPFSLQSSHCHTSHCTQHFFAASHCHKFHGQRPEECNEFLQQCSLALEMQLQRFYLQRFPTESVILFIISLLTGRALQWAETLWRQSGPVSQSLDSFVAHFHKVFGKPAGDTSIGDQLYHSKQGKLSINDYALKFCTLAAASSWKESSLITTFRQGLSPQLQLHLTAYNDPISLEKCIQLSIWVAHCMQGCVETSQGQPSTSSCRQPEQLSRTHANRINMFIYGGMQATADPEVMFILRCIRACDNRPPRPLVSFVQANRVGSSPLTTEVFITVSDISFPVFQYISSNLCGQFHLQKMPNERH